MYYVYLIQSIPHKQIYIGSTVDLERRMEEHNNSEGFGSTRRYKPWRLIYYEAYRSEKDAREREKQLKYHGRALGQLKRRIQSSLDAHEKNTSKGAGFTLVEFLIYILIVGVLLLVLAQFGFRVVNDRARTIAQREVEQNLRFSIEEITKEIRAASGINSPSFGGTSTALSLAMDTPAKNPTVFVSSESILTKQEGGSPVMPLTSSQVKVTGLIFTNTSYGGSPGNVNVAITIEYKNPSGRIEYSDTISFSSSASLRK